MCMKKEIIKINKKHGGIIINKSNLEFAVDRAKEEKNIYKSNAHLLKGIIQGHPFLDGNKSTASEVVLKIFSKEKIGCNKKSFEKGIINLAKEKNTPIIKIERNLRKWCKKK